MADVFLSYCSADRAAARRVRDVLAGGGLDVFWDQQVPAGHDWDDWVRGKLEIARTVVVLWSKASAKSPNVKHEAIIARDAGKLIPAFIETMRPNDLPMGLYMVQTANLHDWRNSSSGGYAQLLSEIGARLDRSVLAQANTWSSRTALIAGAATIVAALGAVWFFTYGSRNAPREASVASLSDPAASSTPQTSAPPPANVAPSVPPPLQLQKTPPPPDRSAGTPTPAPVEPFSHRMVGRWRPDDKASCADSYTINLDGTRLVFASKTLPGYLHEIDSDTPTETRTIGRSPDSIINLTYKFRAQTNGATGQFDLQMITPSGNSEIWHPCASE
jgi:hypothetical protein